MFKVPVLTSETRWKTMMWRCQLSDSMMDATERKAREHVVDHLLPPEGYCERGDAEKVTSTYYFFVSALSCS